MEHTSKTIETDGGRATAWLSEGLESLIRELASRPTAAVHDFDFDVIIVGSGYGGAVALSRLAGYANQETPLRICLLERGKEYLAGTFPRGFADLAGHVRFDGSASPRSKGVPGGLFDVKSGPDVHALVASGLGGGSLINAGVMAWPVDAVFANPVWPDELRRDYVHLQHLAQSLKRELGTTSAPTDLPKVKVMRGLGGTQGADILDITVVRDAGMNAQGVQMQSCIGCGDCFTGCNHRAKSSLDVTLLVSGRRHPGVRIYTGANVLRLEAMPDSGWQLEVVHTDDKKRRREGASLTLRSHIVILAAGTFGSTEILMRSAKAGMLLSKALGERFSSNGDSLAEIYDSRLEVRSVADERVPPKDRGVGPTITTVVDRRKGNLATDFVVQDISVPAAMRRAFEEISVTANALQLLGEPDQKVHSSHAPPRDPNAVDAEITKRSLLVAMIGHDEASGKLVMNKSKSGGPHEDGKLWVSWPGLRDDPRFADRQRYLEQLANPIGIGSGIGGRVLANPIWRALPEKVTGILDVPLGPQLTVHPLGGCVMASDGGRGVVDHLGRVFIGSGQQVYESLVVLDGSTVPMSLGINPALTIAALADRAIRRLRDQIWGFEPAPVRIQESTLSFPRPIFREVPTNAAPTPRATTVQVSERLCGSLRLDLGSGRKLYDVEFELWSKPTELASLMSCSGDRSLQVDPGRSELRVFDPDAPTMLGRPEIGKAVSRMQVHGQLRLLGYGDSSAFDRARRGGWAWLRNRGLRDIAQSLLDSQAGSVATSRISLRDHLRMLYALATRAGASRRLEYELELTQDVDEPYDSIPVLLGRVSGHKNLTYCVAGNPWTQLQQIEVTKFPGWIDEGGDKPRLHFDLTFPDRAKMALLKLSDQQDMPSALADLGSFALYILRTLLHVHVWTFRAPDTSPVREPQRLPGRLPGLGNPTREYLDLGTLPDGKPIQALLSRYHHVTDPKQPPVLLIHGYSASGTTFAHEAIPEGGLAGHLCRKGRDVWVLDLRSSCGMPTARERWTFEQIGYSDIPIAVERVLRLTNHGQVDIVAHCMGSAMLCMALLGAYPDAPNVSDPHLRERRLLPSRIHRLVMSQVGPDVIMAPENIFRSYIMRYVRHYLPLAEYSFNTAESPSQADAMLDRVLASIPYSEDEFRLENPVWPLGVRTRWVAARHRMDALYGRTFKLANMPSVVLDQIDDFFGPLNLDTVAQVLHFTKTTHITDAMGKASFSLPGVAEDRLTFPILSLHSGQNGLASPLTAETMGRYLAQLRDGRVLGPDDPVMSKLGHQDSLIGKYAPGVFRKISSFLEE